MYYNGEESEEKPPSRTIFVVEDNTIKEIVSYLRVGSYFVIIYIWYEMLLLAKDQWKASMVGCTGDIIECLINMQSNFDQILYGVFKCSLMIFLMFIHGIHINNFVMKAIGILIPLYIFYHLASTSKGFNWEDHSQGNFLMMKVCWVIYTVIYTFILIGVKIGKKSMKLLALYVTTCMFFAMLFYNQRVLNSCKEVKTGLLPGYEIDESGNECQWNKPEICWHVTIFGMMKPVYWGRSSCLSQTQDLDRYKEQLKKLNKQIVSFPNVSDLDRDAWMHYEVL